MSDDYRARLIAARERLGLTRRLMAARLLTPRQTYEQWERGHRRTPGVAVVAAEALSGGRSGALTIRQQIAALADGTRTVREVAIELGLTPHLVHKHTWLLRRAGGRPVFRSSPGHSGRRTENARRVLDLADGTRSIADIARAIGRSAETVTRYLIELRNAGHSAPVLRAPGRRHGPQEATVVHRVRQLADGTRTIQQIVDAIGPPADAAAVYRALYRLRRRGVAAATAATPRGRPLKRERDAAIIAAIAAGARPEDVAAGHEISRSRVLQIVARAKTVAEGAPS